MSSVQAAADAAAALTARREEIARHWADLPLFTAVFAGQREDAYGAASRLVDTLVAQHLMKTAMAVRLMGAECVISGIRPPIAQTIGHLGIDLGEITTRATLSDALKYALTQTGARPGTGG